MITRTKVRSYYGETSPSGEWVEKEYFEGSCVSADEKPTDQSVGNGSILIEMDTSTVYMYDEANQAWRAW